MRPVLFTCVLGLAVFAATGGCKPAAPKSNPPANLTPLSADTVLRVHWVGKKRLGIAASAYSLMRLWDAPQSKPLERQVIQQLLTAPWRLTGNEANTQAGAALEPLLDDLVRDGCFVEIRQAEGGPVSALLAVRADEAGAERWRVNAPIVLQTLTGVFPSSRPGGWTLVNPRSPVRWEFSRVGGWVVLGAGPEQNALFTETLSRIQREGQPFVMSTNGYHPAHVPDPKTPGPSGGDYWLAADVDLQWLAAVSGQTNAPAPLPRASFMLTGNGEKALTTGEFKFSQPHGLILEPWRIPDGKLGTNFIGFTAVRGFQSWLTQSAAWSHWSVATPPNQFFAWADREAPMQMHVLAPAAGAKAFTDSLGAVLSTRGNEWIQRSGGGNFVRVPEVNGVVWEGLPLIAPYLRAAGEGDGALVSGGLVPQPAPATNVVADIYPRPTLAELLADLQSRSNVVAYSWETTGERIEAWLFVTQVLRVASRRAQMPAETASSRWLQTSRPRLGNALTVVSAPAPDRLSFARESTVGFTALELHLLADWLESPQFPRGTHSRLTPAPVMP
jgi:hypothetical protein